VGLFLGGPTSVFGVSSFSIFAQVLLRKWCLWQLNVICSQCVKIRFLWILVYLSLFVGMTIPGILMWVEWWGLVCWLGPLANFFFGAIFGAVCRSRFACSACSSVNDFVIFVLVDLYILQVCLNKWRLSKSVKFSSNLYICRCLLHPIYIILWKVTQNLESFHPIYIFASWSI